MYIDPIVKEVREAGAILVKKANYDVHIFFDRLRETQKKYIDRLVNKTNLHKAGGSSVSR